MQTISFLKYLARVMKLNRSASELFKPNHFAVYREWSAQLESGKYPLDLELPWLSIQAKNYMEEYLCRRKKENVRVFEYGSGGSSLFFLKYASTVVSVEHDEVWFDLVSKRVKEKECMGWKGLLIRPETIADGQSINLNKSNPMDYYSEDLKFTKQQWRAYASSIDMFADGYFDIVLVDGRSRPSCLFHSVSKVKKGGLLVLDNAERSYYLASGIIPLANFQLVCSSNGALICTHQFTQTNVYLKQ